MRSLRNPADARQILARLATIRPDSPRRWGRMNASQMICHLADAMRLFMGERPAALCPVPAPRPVMRWIALWAPMPWPHGFKAAPELDQESAGTRPALFATDLEQLQQLLHRFTAETFAFSWPHPHFGFMREREWMRLAYLHADHHLRQFGA